MIVDTEYFVKLEVHNFDAIVARSSHDSILGGEAPSFFSVLFEIQLQIFYMKGLLPLHFS